jgi:hypothetical protein
MNESGKFEITEEVPKRTSLNSYNLFNILLVIGFGLFIIIAIIAQDLFIISFIMGGLLLGVALITAMKNSKSW